MRSHNEWIAKTGKTVGVASSKATSALSHLKRDLRDWDIDPRPGHLVTPYGDALTDLAECTNEAVAELPHFKFFPGDKGGTEAGNREASFASLPGLERAVSLLESAIATRLKRTVCETVGDEGGESAVLGNGLYLDAGLEVTPNGEVHLSNWAVASHGVLLDEINLGPRPGFGNTFPISDFDAIVVDGTEPSMCPRTDRTIPVDWLPTILEVFKNAGLVKSGQTIHWVGSQSKLENVCVCFRKDWTVEINDAAKETESVGLTLRPKRSTERDEFLSDDQALARLLKIYTNGISDERVKSAENVLRDNKLTVGDKLTKIDALMPFPPTASAEQLGKMLGVTKQAVMKTTWWIDNRKGERENEIGRRRDNSLERGEHYESGRANDQFDRR